MRIALVGGWSCHAEGIVELAATDRRFPELLSYSLIARFNQELTGMDALPTLYGLMLRLHRLSNKCKSSPCFLLRTTTLAMRLMALSRQLTSLEQQGLRTRILLTFPKSHFETSCK